MTPRDFSGRTENKDGRGAVEWAVTWAPSRDPFTRSYCNTIPTQAGGTHEQGLRNALTKALRAHGERTTWVIEAGRMGNEKPIQITREVWTAPDLVLTVSSRDFDPRSGEVTYRLKGVRRGEPDASLMRVPADYGQGRAPGPKASG